MISVLICSTDKLFLNQIKNNIENTIGIEHEILFFDNSIERRGLCAVYNSLAQEAKFPYLCFVHEDIIFETINWGVGLENIFLRNSDIGVIGVAGSKYKSSLFSGWFTGIEEFDCANILHKYPNGDELMSLRPHKSNLIEEVVCIDGVFISCKQELWRKVRFNEEQLEGFHFYDIDFSIRASFYCSVSVTYQISITHITTGGDFGDSWVETAIQFHSFFKDKLPNTKLVNYSGWIESKIAKTWLDVLKKYEISWKNKIRWIQMQKLYLNPVFYYPMFKFLLYKPLGLSYVHKLFRKR